LPQADDRQQLLVTTRLLLTLLDCSPRFSPAAVKGNITRGLVRVLRNFCVRPDSLAGPSSDFFSALDAPLSCLCKLMQYDNDNHGGVRVAALDAGIVLVLCDLLAVCDEPRIMEVLTLSTSLLLVTSPGDGGQWTGRLPHAIVRLLNASPPVAAAQAADTLFNMCITHRQLLLDCDTWGMGDSLRRLAAHSDPGTAAAAKKLLSANT
jgi:hypothetical protein